MILTIVRLAIVPVVLLGLVTIGLAQGSEVSGIVQRVDVATGTVYFTDGRTVHVDPGARLAIDGKEVQLSDIQPGWTLVTSAPAAAPPAVSQPAAPPPAASPPVAQPSVAPPAVTQPPIAQPPPAAQPPVAAPTPSSVDATGIVTQIDPRTGTIAMQDGRVIRVTPGTTVWQPTTLGAVVPGASVFVRNAEPLDFRPPATPAASRPYQMGTISSVDASRAHIVLSDGSTVRLRSGVQPMFNGQPLALTELRPGDEVVIGLPASSAVAVTPAGPGVSALPRQALDIIDGEYVYVVRRPQS
jgi:hypothetical protein